MSEIFKKPVEEYSRVTDYKKEARKQLADYLVITRKMSYDEAMSVVLKAEEAKCNNKVNKLITRRITYWERNPVTLDKKAVTCNYDDYHTSAFDKNYTVAPTGTCYTKRQVVPDNKGTLKIENAKDMDSLDSGWTNDNKNARSAIKKEAFIAFSKKDMLTFAIKSVAQKGKKLRNNALSGTYSLQFLPHATATGHNTLTGTNRITASTANLFSENNVSGSRFYKSYTDIFAEAITMINMSNENNVKNAINKLNLVIPKTSDIEQMIFEGTKFNFINSKEYSSVVKFINALTDYQKCAWYYSQSWYNIIQINHDNIHSIIDAIVEDGVVENYTNKDIDELKANDDELKNMLHGICLGVLLDRGSNYDDMLKEQRKNNLPDIFPRLVYVNRNIKKFLETVEPIIKAFFKDIHAMPINVTDAKSKTMIDIALSDTDSSCDSYGKIGSKAKGADKALYSKDDIPRSAVFGFLNAVPVNNLLVSYGANMNIKKENYGIIAFESEKLWESFISMRVSKHYFNKESMSEMNVIDGEIATSGVSLINAKAPQKYRDYSEDFKAMIINATNNNHMDVKDMMTYIINIENEIENELYSTPDTLLKTDKIKPESGYKLPWKQSNYYHVRFWDKVFSAKYGKCPEAPLNVVRIPLTTDSANKLKEYLATQDTLFANNVSSIITEAGKKSGLPSLMLPLDNVRTHGVPKELVPIIDKEKVLLGLMTPFYTILSAIGLAPRKGKTMKYTYEEQFGLDN